MADKVRAMDTTLFGIRFRLQLARAALGSLAEVFFFRKARSSIIIPEKEDIQ
jgi:hypothetical protein